MGTSTAYGGPEGGTPLVPSWLGDNDSGNPPNSSPEGDSNGAANGQSGNTVPTVPIPPSADPQRFTSARTNFTKYARSGGGDRASLGRAIAKYVSKSSGGSRTAAQRMGASRGSGARLLGFLVDAQSRGIREALRSLNLESLAGRPITEIFLGLADYICPGASTVDEGIAREAYIETIIELTEEGITNLETFTAEQMQMVFEMYATHAIEARICNDIGTKAIIMPASADAARFVEEQFRDFIRGGVSDALTRAIADSSILTIQNVQGFVDSVYESAYSTLNALGEAEANR